MHVCCKPAESRELCHVLGTEVNEAARSLVLRGRIRCVNHEAHRHAGSTVVGMCTGNMEKRESSFLPEQGVVCGGHEV